MGRIRKNVNWTASISQEQPESHFNVIGVGNQKVVHALSAESIANGTVLFEQCELGETGIYKNDECYINQSPVGVFVFKYYDYNSDGTTFSSGATVLFLNGEEIVHAGTVGADGSCAFRDITGSLSAVTAHVVDRKIRFNETHVTLVEPLSAYQTTIRIIRETESSANYKADVNASISAEYDIDNEQVVEILSGGDGQVHMLHDSGEVDGKISVISGGEGTITYDKTGNKVRYSRNQVDETKSYTKFADAKVLFYYQSEDEEDAKTITFVSPKKANISYSTTYKLLDYSESVVYGITDTSYEESARTLNMYDTNVFAYLEKRPSSVDGGSVGLDVIAYDGNSEMSGLVSSSIELKKLENYYDEKMWNELSTASLSIMSNDQETFQHLTASLHVGNKERWIHNERRTARSGKGGSTQFKLANESNAIWAMNPDNGIVQGGTTAGYNNHPGFLRMTENPLTRLNVAKIKYAKGSVPTIVESGTTRQNSWNYKYMGSGNGQNEDPTTMIKYAPTTYATWLVMDSGNDEYALSHEKTLTFLRFTHNPLKAIESSANTFYSRISSANYRIDEFTAKTTVVYPQFGEMSYRDQKYILFFSPNSRHVAIISRDTGTTAGESLESSIFSDGLTSVNRQLVNETAGKINQIGYLSAVTSVKLFDIENGNVNYTEEWGLSDEQSSYDINNHAEGVETSGYQWSVVMNRAKAVVSASTVIGAEDIFFSGATSIYGFLYSFDVSDENSATTKTSLSLTSSGVYSASTSFYTRTDTLGAWSIPTGTELPEGKEFFNDGGADWITVKPIMISEENTGTTSYSGLTTVVNRAVGNEPLKSSYQLNGERGMIRVNGSSFHVQLDNVSNWRGILVKPEENSTNSIRDTYFELVQRDKYHFNKEYLTRLIQDMNDAGTSPKMWINDDVTHEPGEKARNETYYDIIQKSRNTTDDDILLFMDNKIRTDTRYSSVYEHYLKPSGGTIVAVMLERDNQIKTDIDPSKSGNPYNIGPWKYDFVNATFAPFEEYLCIELIGDPRYDCVNIKFNKSDNTTGKITRSYTMPSGDWPELPSSGSVLPYKTSGGGTVYTKMYIRGNLEGAGNGVGSFVIEAVSGNPEIKVSDNVMSLRYARNVIQHDAFYSSGDTDYMFASLFSGNTLITDASRLYLLSNTRKGCFKNMFAGCTNLRLGPRLLAWNLSDECYSGMFSGCTSLTDLYCMAKVTEGSNPTANWMSGVPSNKLTFVRNNQSTDEYVNGLGIPTNTNIITLDDGRS